MAPEGLTQLPCCISHQFHSAATKISDQIAAVHVADDAIGHRRNQISKTPPIYDRDVSFTYLDVMSVVESFSRRIRRILGGGDNLTDADYVYTDNLWQHSQENTSGKLARNPHIVGVYITPSIEYIVAVLSILRCGEAFLPLDPSWPKERVLSVISSSESSLIVCKSSKTDNLNWIVNNCGCSVLHLNMQACFDDWLVNCDDLEWPCEIKRPRRFCYLMYTSGSTGKPKGVCGTEAGILNRYLWMQSQYPVHGDDVLLFKTSISFVDHLQEFFAAILAGATVIIPPFDLIKANPFCIVDLIEVYGICRLISVPTLVRALIPLEIQRWNHIRKSLKLLVLSGEPFPVSLWKILYELMPETTILNLYGSTEVSGDCTYFDCNNLPYILESESIVSVPIGKPIYNCEIELVGENSDGGEISVAGACVFTGYFDELIKGDATRFHFRTGDYADRLKSGDLVYLGRKDRIIQVNGQRVALEEVENALREQPTVKDAAVISEDVHELSHMRAFLVMKKSEGLNVEDFVASIRIRLAKKLPKSMIPTYYTCVKGLPISDSGKIDYAWLSRSTTRMLKRPRSAFENSVSSESPLQIIKKAFSDALQLENFLDHDDFFIVGGNSISAAHTAHKLGIDMRLLYKYPTPYKLLNGLQYESSSHQHIPVTLTRANFLDHTKLLPNNSEANPLNNQLSCRSESDESDARSDLWLSNLCFPMPTSFSRANQITTLSKTEISGAQRSLIRISNNTHGYMQELWKVPLKSCVDASPLVIYNDGTVNVFIGSHSHMFLCIEAVSGIVQWEVELEGRVECSAAITGDALHVVVGCYKGKIYFLDYMTGSESWAFQTDGEVKMQPVLDRWNSLMWCGSHDHCLYALDYLKFCCIYKVKCGGSIYGSPAMDTVHSMVYVASTSGRVLGLSIKAKLFEITWSYESGSPIFGSLAMDFLRENVICCLVDGHVIALSSEGCVTWKVLIGGPIFAGVCISSVLPSQALVCSRDGTVYSLDVEDGEILWEYKTGNPITASAYIDEQSLLQTDPSDQCNRLACICTSSGKIHVLGINPHAKMEKYGRKKAPMVREFAVMEIPGDVFSSPVMIGGRIFVGCRDDHIRCITVSS